MAFGLSLICLVIICPVFILEVKYLINSEWSNIFRFIDFLSSSNTTIKLRNGIPTGFNWFHWFIQFQCVLPWTQKINSSHYKNPRKYHWIMPNQTQKTLSSICNSSGLDRHDNHKSWEVHTSYWYWSLCKVI